MSPAVPNVFVGDAHLGVEWPLRYSRLPLVLWQGGTSLGRVDRQVLHVLLNVGKGDDNFLETPVGSVRQSRDVSA